MEKVTITRDDLTFCCYAVMRKDKQIRDYAVALFYDLEDAEKFVDDNYSIQMTLNDEVYIAETNLPNEL